MMSVAVCGLQLIYNGDADACVPYIGNEEWINDALVGPGLISEAEAWRPWFTADTPDMPAGYVTTYDVQGGSSPMTFLTIRLAGHSKSTRHIYTTTDTHVQSSQSPIVLDRLSPSSNALCR
jgi:hypothetical protein